MDYDKESEKMNNELTDEQISELQRIPYQIAEQSMYYDSMDIDVNISGYLYGVMSVEFRAEILMCLCVSGVDEIMQIPIEYTRGITSEKLFMSRGILLEIEASTMDKSISDCIKKQLVRIRTPLRHIAQITFMKNPVRRHNGPV